MNDMGCMNLSLLRRAVGIVLFSREYCKIGTLANRESKLFLFPCLNI